MYLLGETLKKASLAVEPVVNLIYGIGTTPVFGIVTPVSSALVADAPPAIPLVVPVAAPTAAVLLPVAPLDAAGTESCAAGVA